VVGREDEVHFMLPAGWWTTAGLVLSLVGVVLLFRYACLIGFALEDNQLGLRSVAIHERQLLSVDMKYWGGWDCFWSCSEQSVKSLGRY
jgi:hypothetical protein